MNKKEEKELSKFLAYKLRHDPSIKRDDRGYVLLADLGLSSEITLDMIKNVVANNEKSRFTMIERDNEWYICANQGHSKEVGENIDDDKSMTKLIRPLIGVFHGTYQIHLPSIKESGINRMGRKHIHLAKGMSAKSGKRQDCDAIIYIDMEKAMSDGISFYESANGVILTEGRNGVLPSDYFSSIDYL